MGRRVVITGLGALSPNGLGVEAYWDALFAGRSGVRRISQITPEEHRHHCGGELPDFDPAAYLPESQAALLGRATQISLIASQMAMEDCRLPPGTVPRERFGIFCGASMSPMDVVENAIRQIWGEKGYVAIHPASIAGSAPHVHAVTANVTMDGAASQAVTVSTLCTSGGVATGLAADRIRDGLLDAALCGGAESAFAQAIYNAFETTGMMYHEPREPEAIMRPFNVDRDGGVLSEGGAFVVLEPLEEARRRGAKIYGEWLGYATAAPQVRGRPTDIIRAGLRTVMENALAEARLTAADVDYVSANAASARRTDEAEALALWDVFGERTPRIPVSAIKSMIGNPTGAVVPLQVVALCGTFARGLVPPTINITEQDPRCRLDVVPNVARRNRVRVGLINVRALDGSMACVLIGAPPGADSTATGRG